ncbi:MAG: NRDE family protein [Geothrix sp.]|nr:NRDE family protein [Geothrix sp.]
MCLIGFHWRPGGPVPLLVAANRDEFYDRPTAPLAWWEGGRLLAGRDLRAGGTWLGVTREGRCAVLTNHRDPRKAKPGGPSRGQLPVRFLEDRRPAAAFLEDLREEAARYSPFNLLLFDGGELRGYESHQDRLLSFTPGVHAVSNGAFDAPWPKVERLKAGLAASQDDEAALLALLGEAQPCEDARLPDTGVPLAWERILSPAFVRTGTYGTRATTILRLGRDAVSMLEQRFTFDGPEARTEFRFQKG